MSTITSLGANDSGATSRIAINANFSALNSEKIETSVISTDGTLAGNSDTELPTEKAVKTYVDANRGSVVTTETTSGATHSLTTVVNQKVIVWAKGTMDSNGSTNPTITLKYNGVTKDTYTTNTSDVGENFSLMYTETPGTATANITVEISAGSMIEVVIIVMKIL